MYNDYMQHLFGDNYSPYYNIYESPIAENNDENYYNYNFYPNYEFSTNYNSQNFTSRNSVTEIESFYPELYNIIYPMIKKICSKRSSLVTEDILNEMTDEIYNNIETDNTLNVNINIDNTKNETRFSSNSTNNKTIGSENNNNNRNYNFLHDFIKILLIRELIENSKHRFPPKPKPFPHMNFPPPNFNIPEYQRPPIRPKF